MRILANDGISNLGKEKLEGAGFEVDTTRVAQEQLGNYIKENDVVGLLVRSATKVRKELIDGLNGQLKLIGRGGVGMDNIDVQHAKDKGIHVINTPAASSRSVAELTFAHLFSMVRYLFDANQRMPLEGDSHFKELKKSYSAGIELKGKTLGIIGFGRIGQEVARMAYGLGMKVVAHDKFSEGADIEVSFFDGQKVSTHIKTTSLEDVLKQSDFVTLHIPASDKPVIGSKEIAMMKDQAGIVNTARGGMIEEKALLEALKDGKLRYAGLDVFENEPQPDMSLLMCGYVSLTPHIGAATLEAQDRIGEELADQIIKLLN